MPFVIDPKTGQIAWIPDPAATGSGGAPIPGETTASGQPAPAQPSAGPATGPTAQRPAAGSAAAGTPSAKPNSAGITSLETGAEAVKSAERFNANVSGNFRGAGSRVGSVLKAPGNFLAGILGGPNPHGIVKGLGHLGVASAVLGTAYGTGMLDDYINEFKTPKQAPLPEEEAKARKQIVAQVFNTIGPFNAGTHQRLYESSPNRKIMDELFMNPADKNASQRLEKIQGMVAQAMRKTSDGEPRLQTPATVYEAIRSMYEANNAQIPPEQRKKMGVGEFPDVIQLPKAFSFKNKEGQASQGSVFLVRDKDGKVRMIRSPHGKEGDARPAEHSFYE